LKPNHTCPKCACEDTTRLRRKAAERLLIVLRPYSCFECGHKFYTLAEFPNLRGILHGLALRAATAPPDQLP